MSAICHIPNSMGSARCELWFAMGHPPDQLSRERFVRAWSAIAYLFPGLHPDGFDHPDSGWPLILKPFAAEAWRRSEAGELVEEELYCCDAQWCGLYDRMEHHEQDEIDRRLALAAEFGEPLN